MSINRNTRMLTSDPCDTCKGTGTALDQQLQLAVDKQDIRPEDECRRCEGTGRKLISISELVDFIDQEFGKKLRRQGYTG